MQKIALLAGLVLLFAAEILRVYFIMPFPGSQHGETIGLAYFLDQYIIYIRILALLLIIAGLYKRFSHWKKWQRVILLTLFMLYGLFFYLFNFRFQADTMFYQPRIKNLVSSAVNKIPLNKLVLGVMINNEAKAYPIEIIGYHHQVLDTIGTQPVIVTYCSVCRSGRAFSPIVDGKEEKFRLVGMDHFNAMFEDNTTHSWWRQVTGEAIAGPKKGRQLTELPSYQMTLSAWIRKYPNSLILQPDSNFNKQYKNLEGFDKGTIKSHLEKRDSGSWQFKSWIVGIQHQHQSKAYDWNDLLKEKLINDSFAGLPLVLTIETDSVSFHVWNRRLKGQTLEFSLSGNPNWLTDINTNSIWDAEGNCIEGALKGEQLTPVQSYQEFWHSWRTFHPGAMMYKKSQ